MRDEAIAGRVPALPSLAFPWRRLLPLMGVLLALAAWELVSRWRLLPPSEFPPAVAVGQALLEEMGRPSFWASVGQTLAGWASGLLIGVLVAVPLGILIGRSAFIFRSLRLVIEILRPVPPVALIPLAVLCFGIGNATKIVLIALTVFWPMLFQMIYGVQGVDPVARDTLRSYRLGTGMQVRYLLIPSAAPYFMTGLRISASVALIVGIATELVIGAPGLGRVINELQTNGAHLEEYAYILAVGVLGWLVNAIFRRLERHALRWHQSQRNPR